MKSLKSVLFVFIFSSFTTTNAQNMPTGKSWTVTQNKNVKVHTYMSPAA